MFVRVQLIFCLSYFLILGCGGSSANSGKTRTASEEELINRLSSLMVANPQQQADIDRNTLINYAIDSLLDVQMSPSGMFYSIDKPGEGDAPISTSQVSAHYRGRLLNGKEFDSSYNRGEPLFFNIQQVIKGWQEGLQMLKTGGKATILVPSNLAYGKHGFSGLIPPNSSLRFEIHLVAVHDEE